MAKQSELFSGRVAAVTGAGKGLGKAYALWLARQGCAIVVNNRVHPGRPSAAQAVADEITAAGGQAVAHEVAVDDPDAGTSLVALAMARFGRFDSLVCNAGVMPEGPFGEMDPAEIRRLVDINVLGTIYPLQAAWRHMLGTGYGRIVLTGSTVGLLGYTGVTAYGGTRAVALGLARSLALETPAGADIGVNVILPFAYTDMSSASIDAATGGGMADALSPDGIAPTVGWLCSDACKHTGRVFHASSLKVTRLGVVESAAVAVPPDDVAALSDAAFGLDPIFEPANSTESVGRLLGG